MKHSKTLKKEKKTRTTKDYCKLNNFLSLHSAGGMFGSKQTFPEEEKSFQTGNK